MSEETILEQPVETPATPIDPAAQVEPVTPVPEPVAAPAPEPEQRHEYQPTDELGRPLGGKQVIKYRTHDELVQKLTEQNILIQRRLREEKKKNQLGITETAEIPADAPRFDGAAEFNPRELSADEKVILSRNLLDPEKFQEAADTLFEATVGAKPEDLRKTLAELKQDKINRTAVAESEAFVRANPDFYQCRENGEVVANWVARRGLAPVRENFQRAYEALKNQGVLIEAPAPEPVVAAPPSVAAAPPAPPVEPLAAPTEPPAASVPAAKPAAAIPTGFTRTQTTSEGPVPQLGDDIVYEFRGVKYTGLQAIEMMPADEFKRRVIADKTFEKKYEQLLAQRAARKGR